MRTAQARYISWLITQRSRVQIPPPQPIDIGTKRSPVSGDLFVCWAAANIAARFPLSSIRSWPFSGLRTIALIRPRSISEASRPRWTAQNRPLIDTSKPATTGVAAETNGVLLRGLLGAQVGLDLGAPAPRSAFEDVRVMEQPIEERRDGGVAEQLATIIDGSV